MSDVGGCLIVTIPVGIRPRAFFADDTWQEEHRRHTFKVRQALIDEDSILVAEEQKLHAKHDRNIAKCFDDEARDKAKYEASGAKRREAQRAAESELFQMRMQRQELNRKLIASADPDID